MRYLADLLTLSRFILAIVLFFWAILGGSAEGAFIIFFVGADYLIRQFIKTKKEEARALIEGFVGKRKFFAHPKFRQEFTTENIMGVYFPYMLVDANCHGKFIGEAEHKTRQYTVTVGSGDDKRHETRYDADLYAVEREFDISIDDLTIESSQDKLNKNNKEKIKTPKKVYNDSDKQLEKGQSIAAVIPAGEVIHIEDTVLTKNFTDIDTNKRYTYQENFTSLIGSIQQAGFNIDHAPNR